MEERVNLRLNNLVLNIYKLNFSNIHKSEWAERNATTPTSILRGGTQHCTLSLSEKQKDRTNTLFTVKHCTIAPRW